MALAVLTATAVLSVASYAESVLVSRRWLVRTSLRTMSAWRRRWPSSASPSVSHDAPHRTARCTHIKSSPRSLPMSRRRKPHNRRGGRWRRRGEDMGKNITVIATRQWMCSCSRLRRRSTSSHGTPSPSVNRCLPRPFSVVALPLLLPT